MCQVSGGLVTCQSLARGEAQGLVPVGVFWLVGDQVLANPLTYIYIYIYTLYFMSSRKAFKFQITIERKTG